MKTKAAIEMDFARARAQAREIDEIADELMSVSKKSIEGTKQNLQKNWQGSNARSYLAKTEQLQGNIKKTAQELNDIADTVRAIARKLYEAEMAALRLAQTSGGGGGGALGGGGGGVR